MTKEEIIQLVVDNHLELEVCEALHTMIFNELINLRDELKENNAELSLIKTFADVNKLDVIKTILQLEKEN
jgi:hypothetical protein